MKGEAKKILQKFREWVQTQLSQKYLLLGAFMSRELVWFWLQKHYFDGLIER